jgi:hypothetical protein
MNGARLHRAIAQMLGKRVGLKKHRELGRPLFGLCAVHADNSPDRRTRLE